ncbi:MAG: hypothetical protein IT435_14800 [Phycisphaerales bacterium]|nr:hypothetical protein [Phycisphaerales bacterium]
MRISRFGGLGAALLGLVPAIASARPVYDAAADFSATSNPNGVWSFGYQTTLGTGFNLETLSGNYLGVDYWLMGPTIHDLPGAFHNPSSTTNVNYGSAIFDPGMLILHPGASGEYSLARFTAPVAGSYQVNIGFIGQDLIGGTTTDVHVWVNSSSVFSGAINGYHATASPGVMVVSLQANETIDAAVGYGFNSYNADSTGLDFRVEIVPSPGAAALMGLGGLIAIRRRRR